MRHSVPQTVTGVCLAPPHRPARGGGMGKKERPAKPALSATALFTQLTSLPVRLSACVPAAHDLSHFRKFVRRYRRCVRISARASASETNKQSGRRDGWKRARGRGKRARAVPTRSLISQSEFRTVFAAPPRAAAGLTAWREREEREPLSKRWGGYLG